MKPENDSTLTTTVTNKRISFSCHTKRGQQETEGEREMVEKVTNRCKTKKTLIQMLMFMLAIRSGCAREPAKPSQMIYHFEM